MKETKEKISRKFNFVIEQNQDAKTFAWSVISAPKSVGMPVFELPYSMHPGEKIECRGNDILPRRRLC